MKFGKKFLSAALSVIKEAVDRGECGQQDVDYWCEVLQYEMDRRGLDRPKWVTKDEASAMLGISTSTFDRRVLQGELPRGESKRHRKNLYWRREDIEQYMKASMLKGRR